MSPVPPSKTVPLAANRLLGKRILVVEDDYFLALATCRGLEELGAIVLGPASAVEDALIIIAATNVEAAVLDIELHQENSYPVADELLRQDIAFIFLSSVSRGHIPERYDSVGLLPKSAEIGLVSEALFGP